MKERSLICRDWEVRAILAGRKTQFRVPVKLSNSEVCGSRWNKHRWSSLDFTKADACTKTTIGVLIAGKNAPYDLHLRVPHDDESFQRVRPIWETGDRLWIKEACRIHRVYDPLPLGELVRQPKGIYYDADDSAKPEWCGRYRHARFMPRWAARITLEIVSVRVERVQDITEADATAEGVEPTVPLYGDNGGHVHEGHKEAFMNRWQECYGRDSWQRNDWVWLVEFRNVNQAKGN